MKTPVPSVRINATVLDSHLRNTVEYLRVKCHHCTFSTDFESGLSVHLCRADPALYNEERKEKTKNFFWSEPEFRLLVNTILDLKSKKVRDVNQPASKLLGRSSLAIQKIRIKTEYKRIERVIKAQLSES